MVYEWANYEEHVRHMVGDGKTQDEVLTALRIIGFVPSKRAFQNQLKRWNLPGKHARASKDEQVIETVKQLWERHVLPNDMLRVLNEQKGVDIKKRELSRLRLSLGLYFRAPNAAKEDHVANGSVERGEAMAGQTTARHDKIYTSDMAHGPITDTQQDAVNSSYADAFDPSPSEPLRKRQHRPLSPSTRLSKRASMPNYPPPTPDEVAARAVEKEQAAASRATRIALRHQRRHAHASDVNPVNHNAPPPLPKFPSEMSIQEARAILGLNRDMHQEVRKIFKNICHDLDIVRKKGSTNWHAAKDTLVNSIPALAAAFHPPPVQLKKQSTTAIGDDNNEEKALALDLLCMDVTKGMRTKSVRMTVADAKKILGITPAQITVVRQALTARLLADGFASKTESGEKHWKELRDAWIREQGLKGGEEGTRAANVLCADVMKRVNDSKARKKREGSTRVEKRKAADGSEAEEIVEREGNLVPMGQDVPGLGIATTTASPASKKLAVAFSEAQATAYHPPRSQPLTTTGYGYGTVPTAYTLYEPFPPGFQTMYPEIDPEILKMACGRPT